MATGRKIQRVERSEAELHGAVVDLARRGRTGSPEIIYAPGKTPDQMVKIIGALRGAGQSALATRTDAAQARAVKRAFRGTFHDPVSGILRTGPNLVHPCRPAPLVGIVTAGTSDQKVAEEAALTAEFYGHRVDRILDVGVAGLDRLLRRTDRLRACRVLIVIAGMEGALPSVVAGLVSCPVIAVPTSNGYGANLQGVSALLGMLTSCASGVTVVNIDNGFGAAAAAFRITLPPEQNTP